MQNQIFKIYGRQFKSFIITEDALLISKKKLKSLEKFEKELPLKGLLRTTYSFPFSKITNISFNEGNDFVKLKYKNEKNEYKKMDIEFGDKKLSNRFGHFLGQELKMSKSQKKENKWKSSFYKILWLIFTIGFTYYLTTIKDTIELVQSTSGKSKAVALIFKIIIDKIGHVGVVIIGTLIALLIILKLYTRIKNPSNEIEYQQKLF